MLDQRIAVVGMGGLFPSSPTPAHLWAHVLAAADTARRVPPGRWLLDPDEAFDPAVAAPDRVYSLRGCFLDDIPLDAAGLDLPPDLLASLDPVFHLTLRAGRQAFESGVTGTLDRRRVGVILGNIVLPTEAASRLAFDYLGRTFEEQVRRAGRALPPLSPPGRGVGGEGSLYGPALPAALLARALGLGGGSHTLDAACASSLYALKLAVEELRAGRADAMLAGGVSRPDCLYTQMGFSQLRALSPSGRASPFDARADGLVVGEGAGVFLLKRLQDARRDGDRILAVIAGIGLSNDVGGSLLAPSSEGQLRAMHAAYREAGWSPHDIDLIECHATGTPVGDAVEFQSLRSLWGAGGWQPGQCVISSVKSTVGHLLTAAGAAGLSKILSAFAAQTLPPTANFATPARGIDLDASPFRILTAPRPWPRRSETTPRRAAVSAFGFGGINAHLLLEEYFPAPASTRVFLPSPPLTPVAVVGMAAHFGPWNSLRAFRQRVLGGGETIKPAPPRHWWGVEESAWFREQGLDPAMFAGYYLDDLSVPLDRFRIPPRELQETLPQQLLMLQVAADALAGLELADALRLRTGVFIGLGLDLNTTNFHLRWSLRDPALRDAAGPPLTANRTMGALGSIASSRIAREFHLGGPSFTVSSDETSGLRALEIAVRALQRGDIDRAVVGAVDLAGDVRAVFAAGAGRPYTPGEGAAAVVLRRLEDVQATDTLHAVIKGIGASAADACREAGIDPDSVAHVQTDDDIRAAIGHAGAATGLASLVTACLSPDGPRRALVHSASAGGDCIHVVLEARGPTAITPPPQSTGRTLTLPVGGRPFVIPPLPIPLGEPVVGWAESSRPTGGTETKESAQPQAPLPLGEDRFSIPRTPPGHPPDRETNSPESQEQWRPAFAPVRAPTHPTDLPATETNARAQFGRGGSGVLYPPVGLEDSAHPTALGAQIAAVVTTEDARGRAHSAYLRLSQAVNRTLADNLAFQTVLLEALLSRGHSPPAAAPFLDRPRCLEFAVGSIARVLGPEYAEVDTFPTRVRLPDEPLMLVDRVLHVEGQPRSLGPGRVVTEHDVRPGAWYLDGGRIPTCIAIEAGQADLFLSAYLGIDFHTRGRAVYRLLDAAVTFHRGLPGPGETIRYDIHIDRFFRQGDTHLFRFRFEGTVRGEPLLTMTGGCAGFFTAADLAAGRGVVLTELAQRPRPGIQPDDDRELAPMAVESYDQRQVDALRTGDLAACFGPPFAGLRLAPSLQLPGGRMRLVHRVTHLDPAGGRFGIGLVRAEADIRPDAWFLTCHFVDDQVMPGTLMYECCLHTLRIYLLRRGWVAADGALFEPVPGVAGRLRCRGQVTASTRTVTYEVILKERGYRPEPYALADALMYADGKLIVEITDMALQLTGASRESVTAVWRGRERSAIGGAGVPPARKTAGGTPAPRPALPFTREQLLAFAVGKPSEAFGEPYRVFDEERFIARLPGPPYLFLDRITRIEAEPWKLTPGGAAETEYDVPADAWYFDADRQRTLPFAVLLEVPLQSCGWLAAYMGSALTSPEDLCFRNLGGKADLLAPVRAGDGTLTTRVRVTAVTRSAGMIIQSFDFETRSAARPVYRGSTTFGFFSRAALAQQVGIRDARPYQPTPAEQARARSFDYPRRPPFPDDRWRMVDRVEAFIPDGGPHGLGFIEAGKEVDPAAWFFKAHFYQDPVWPGSLGLESLVQLMKVVAAERWPEAAARARFLPMLGRTHQWTYRGQVLPTGGKVQVQAVITACDDEARTLTADGFLRADGRLIYQMRDFTLTVDSSR